MTVTYSSDEEHQLLQLFRYWGELPGLLDRTQIDPGLYEFHYWNKLPMELKMKILGCLNNSDLIRFRMASKESHLLASKFKPVVPTAASLRFGDTWENINKRSSLQLSVSWLRHKSEDYRFIFIEEGNHACTVVTIRTIKRAEIRERTHCEQDLYTTIIRFLFQLLEDLKTVDLDFHLDSDKLPHIMERLKSELDLRASSSKGVHRDSLKCLTIRADLFGTEPVATILRFLRPCQELVLIRHSFLSSVGFANSEVFDLEEVQKVKKLLVLMKSDLRDDQLNKIRGEELSLGSSRLTSRALNELLRQWLVGERRIKKITITTEATNPMVKAEVFRGVAPVKRNLHYRIEGVQGTLNAQFNPRYLFFTEPQF